MLNRNQNEDANAKQKLKRKCKCKMKTKMKTKLSIFLFFVLLWSDSFSTSVVSDIRAALIIPSHHSSPSPPMVSEEEIQISSHPGVGALNKS